MTTEEEAKTKWCPFIKFSDEGPDAYSMSNRGEVLHRDVEPATIARCIGSACMAWRKGKDAWQRPNGAVIQTQVEPRDGQGRWVSQGYCGAFGETK